MKKILIIFSSIILIFFLKTDSVSASCSVRPTSGICTTGFACTTSTNQKECCTQSATECNCVAHLGSCNHTLPCCTTGDSCSANNICEGAQAASSPGPQLLCGGGINTAIGCIPILSQNDFLAFILRWAVGIGGGIAFLLMLYAGFEIMTASGNPERLKAGQELLTSAISGLILLIFSVFILKFIGVDILGLCKFGFNVGSCP